MRTTTKTRQPTPPRHRRHVVGRLMIGALGTLAAAASLSLPGGAAGTTSG